MKIENLQNVSINALYEAFGRAFFDYEVQLNQTEFETMIHRRGYRADLSFGAFDNGKLVAFTLNGVGSFNNIKTVYDTGTGTINEYRGQGLATKIFNYAIPYLKKAGYKQYLLEVLQHNTKAVLIYKKLGFEITREFNYFGAKTVDIEVYTGSFYPNVHVKPIGLQDKQVLLECCDFNPSWQNNFSAVLRNMANFFCIGLCNNKELLGYAIFEPLTGDIAQLAVKKEYRRQGLGSFLMLLMVNLNKHHSIKILNCETSCISITAFLESFNIQLKGKQYEMLKHL